MKLSINVKKPSSESWLKAVLNDFDTFLCDHADCERKASAMAMSFVAKCPDRTEIIPELIEIALEELEHFQKVYEIMSARGIQLSHSIGEDVYVKKLIIQCHSGRTERFMDRLLIASALETRGAERFRLISEKLETPHLKSFYKMLWTSEAKHGDIFIKLLLNYFDEKDAPECGICDVCLERSKTITSSEDFERYKNKIQNLLKKEKLTVDELVESFSPKYQNRILKVIEYLLDEQMLKKEDNKLVWN